MKIVVSKREDLPNYENFYKRNTLRDIGDEISDTEVLIINTIEDKDMDTSRFLYEAKVSGVKKFIYINAKPAEMIAIIIRGLGGIVESDESLLSDEEALNYIIDAYETMLESTKLDMVESTAIIEDFITGVSENEPRVNNPIYQDRVKRAVQEITERTNKAELTLSKISKSTLDLVKDVSKALNNFDKVKAKLEDKIYELQAKITESPTVIESSNSIFAYPTVRYVGVKNILYIKEKAECKYLLSFLLAYKDYLENVKDKKAKVIVTYQKFIDTSARYKTAVNINMATINTPSLVSSGFIATYQPKNTVMEKLLNLDNDIFIVLDRMWGTEILSGASIRTLYATSGLEAMKRTNIPANKCILSQVEDDSLFMSIPTISNYPVDIFARKTAYYQTCKQQYEKLDRLLDM